MKTIKSAFGAFVVFSTLALSNVAFSQDTISSDALGKADAIFEKIRNETDAAKRKSLIGSLDPLITTPGLNPACKESMQAQRMAAGLFALIDLTDDEAQAAPLRAEIKKKEGLAEQARKRCLASTSGTTAEAAPPSSVAAGFPEKMSALYSRMLKAAGKGDVDNLKALVPEFNNLIAVDGKTASPACLQTAQARLEFLKIAIDYNMAEDTAADQIVPKMAAADKKARELATACPANPAAGQATETKPSQSKPATETAPSSSSNPAASSNPAFSQKLNDLYRQVAKLTAQTNVNGLKALIPQFNELIASDGKTASPACLKTAKAQLNLVEATIAYHSADPDDATELMTKMAMAQQEALTLIASCK